MADFTVGRYLAARLEQIGLRHYFMVPGDYNLAGSAASGYWSGEDSDVRLTTVEALITY